MLAVADPVVPPAGVAVKYLETYSPIGQAVVGFGDSRVGTSTWTAVVGVAAGFTALAGAPDGVDLAQTWAWAFLRDESGVVLCRGFGNVPSPAVSPIVIEVSLDTTCGPRVIRFRSIESISTVLGAWESADHRMHLDIGILPGFRPIIPYVALLTVCEPAPSSCSPWSSGSAQLVERGEPAAMTFAFRPTVPP